MRMCRNLLCARHFPTDVQFCPYCGEAQRSLPALGSASSKGDAVATKAPTQNREIAHPLEEHDEGVTLPPGLTTTTGSIDVDAVSAQAGMMPLHTSRLALLATRPVVWMPVFAMVLLLLASSLYKLPKLIPDAAYETVSCDGTIASELSLLVDLPVQLEPSTKAELLVRVSQQLDAEHVGVQRVNLFSTAAVHGDASTPIFSACTSRAALASLFRLHGTDPHLKTQFADKVNTEMTVRRTVLPSSPLTQVVADLSVSQYLRAPQNTLVVFSDLVEKSNGLSLLECRDPQDAVRTYRAARAGGVERPTFKNVSVDLNVIPDTGIQPATGQCRKTFWNWYFGDVEGVNAHVTMNYLPGRQQKSTNLKGYNEQQRL